MKKYLFLFLLFINQAFAAWVVDGDRSSVSFVSTKQEHIAETHKIPTISGSLTDQGEFKVTLDLASVDTGIEIRDKRMRELLFNVTDFRFAEVTGNISVEQLKTSQFNMPFEATVSLHGKTMAIEGNVNAIRAGETEIFVSLTQPLLISAMQFDLMQGVDTLKQVAGLTSIGYSVPVYFNLVLVKE